MPPRGALVRLSFICALFAGCSLVLLWRLYTFQLRDVDRYRQLASEERRAQIPIIPKRGSLLDAEGRPIAVSVPYDSVYALGPLLGDLDKTATVLSPILGKTPEEIRARLNKEQQQPTVLQSKVPSAVGEQVRALNLPGVYLENEPIREYPEGSLAAQILGFVGQDFKGLSGLELSWNDELAGTPGVIDTEKDTSGQEITLGRRVLTPPREGADVVLTIDRYVQRTAERLLADAVGANKASGGLIMVVEPSTGNVLAAASNPTYSLTDDQIYKPGQESLYKPTIVTNQYEPGSTMKVITMAAAINEGLVSPGTTYNDKGVALVDGVAIRNWDLAANGVITMTGVLQKSSNVATQWISGQLGADRFYRYVDAFGFGKKTGLPLPGEVTGMVRTPTTPSPVAWSRIDLATNSYGQGIAVTPLQLLSAVASFGNDGVLMRPRIVQEVRGPSGRRIDPEPIQQVVTPKTARTLLQMMAEVGGQEAYAKYRIPGYTFAVKTGTADTPTDVGYNTAVTVASTVALLPADNPRFAVLIRLDGPEAMYGGVVAIPVLQRLGQELLQYYRIPPSDLEG